jgi:hypothetical protein
MFVLRYEVKFVLRFSISASGSTAAISRICLALIERSELGVRSQHFSSAWRKPFFIWGDAPLPQLTFRLRNEFGGEGAPTLYVSRMCIYSYLFYSSFRLAQVLIAEHTAPLIAECKVYMLLFSPTSLKKYSAVHFNVAIEGWNVSCRVQY